MPVLAQLPYIRMHVVEAPRVRLLLTYRMRLPSRVLFIPSVLDQLGLVITETVRCGRPVFANFVLVDVLHLRKLSARSSINNVFVIN